MDPAARLGPKFYVHLSGNTQDAHLPWVRQLKDLGQTQVSSPQESNYLVVFCPIASRIGTDIAEALDNLPPFSGQKRVVLVVMHYTFNADHVVVASSRQVDRPFVIRTVDCLFHNGRLLDCNRNNNAWFEVQEALGFPPSAVSPRKSPISWLKRNRNMVIFGLIALIGVVFLVPVLSSVLKK